MVRHVNCAITIFPGWLETCGSPGSGMIRLAHECRSIAPWPDLEVNFFPWRVNVDDVAEYLRRFAPVNERQRHLVVGYSYGGQTAVNFCRALLAHTALSPAGGVEITELWLCDPVRRWRWLPGVAALFGLGKLVVPDEVQAVWGVCQRAPRWSFSRWLNDSNGLLYSPAGHAVAWRGRRGMLLERFVNHSHIDDDRYFRRDVLRAVARLLNTEDP